MIISPRREIGTLKTGMVLSIPKGEVSIIEAEADTFRLSHRGLYFLLCLILLVITHEIEDVFVGGLYSVYCCHWSSQETVCLMAQV